MGMKIQSSGLPPMKFLISRKLLSPRPAIEYVQQIYRWNEVRLMGDM